MLQISTKRFRVDEVQPGMELARSLMTDNGKFALGDGTVLTTSLIDRLRSWDVDYVDIRVTVDVQEKLPPPLTAQQQAVSRQYNDTVSSIKKSFETLRFFKQVPLKEMRELADSAVEPVIDTSGILNHLHVVHRRDDYTFHHSINVAVLCGVLGRWLGYQGETFKDLVLAGLLHDVGKTQIPLEILRKPGKLTTAEMDAMKLHATKGYNLLKELDLPQGVVFAILQHHEREDGSGYPLGVKGDKIHDFAKIVAVADIYDAMTSDKVYKQKTTPFQAVEALMMDMYNKLDPRICSVFLNNVRDFFIGNIVELNDGREAEVVYLGQTTTARPIVRTEEGEFIDLEQRKNISIVRLVGA
ncbi:MAG: HD-GYP domain-containing protein [Negativicutes bacterium]|nr:HD-GYP domain-containing protein [Negativicutes bacterium]